MPELTALTPLRALAALRTITVLCSRCDRRGVLSVPRLLREHGGDAPVTRAWEGLNADCGRRNGPLYTRCDLYCPELAEVVLRDWDSKRKRDGV